LKLFFGVKKYLFQSSEGLHIIQFEKKKQILHLLHQGNFVIENFLEVQEETMEVKEEIVVSMFSPVLCLD